LYKQTKCDEFGKGEGDVISRLVAKFFKVESGSSRLEMDPSLRRNREDPSGNLTEN